MLLKVEGVVFVAAVITLLAWGIVFRREARQDFLLSGLTFLCIGAPWFVFQRAVSDYVGHLRAENLQKSVAAPFGVLPDILANGVAWLSDWSVLGGYATGTLTSEERRQLFEAALQDQNLFDTLAEEETLRDLLSDSGLRRELLAAEMTRNVYGVLSAVLWALILVYIAMGIPLGVFILTQFFAQVPEALVEAARIDGCGHLRIWWQIMLPICKPVIAIINTWSDLSPCHSHFRARADEVIVTLHLDRDRNQGMAGQYCNVGRSAEVKFMRDLGLVDRVATRVAGLLGSGPDALARIVPAAGPAPAWTSARSKRPRGTCARRSTSTRWPRHTSGRFRPKQLPLALPRKAIRSRPATPWPRHRSRYLCQESGPPLPLSLMSLSIWLLLPYALFPFLSMALFKITCPLWPQNLILGRLRPFSESGNGQFIFEQSL